MTAGTHAPVRPGSSLVIRDQNVLFAESLCVTHTPVLDPGGEVWPRFPEFGAFEGFFRLWVFWFSVSYGHHIMILDGPVFVSSAGTNCTHRPVSPFSLNGIQ